MANYPKDQRSLVKVTQRPIPIDGSTLYTCWTCSGDDLSNEIRGAGNNFMLACTAEDTTTSVDVRFLTASEKVHIFECYIAWENAGFGDYFTAEFWAKASPVTSATNSNYTLDPSTHKIRYTPGTGNCTLTGTPTFVQCSNYSYDHTTWNGWWDLDPTGSYPIPSMTQKGQFDWYDIDVIVFRFIKFSVLGTCHTPLHLKSEDTQLLPPNYFIKVTLHNISQTAWKLVGNLVIFREHTVQ